MQKECFDSLVKVMILFLARYQVVQHHFYWKDIVTLHEMNSFPFPLQMKLHFRLSHNQNSGKSVFFVYQKMMVFFHYETHINLYSSFVASLTEHILLSPQPYHAIYVYLPFSFQESAYA